MIDCIEWFDYDRTMKEGPDIAQLAALIGDPARANMLTALMSGHALTATELAGEAGVTVQTASTHLAKLHEGRLLKRRKQGRHKYFALASDDVADLLENMMGVAAKTGQLRTRTGPKHAELRDARVCYNHLAGAKATDLFDSFLARRFLDQQDDELTVTARGTEFFNDLGIDVTTLGKGRSRLCLECLDWSERRSHLGGALGRGLFAHFESEKWIIRRPNSRAVKFTQKGEACFEKLLVCEEFCSASVG